MMFGGVFEGKWVSMNSSSPSADPGLKEETTVTISLPRTPWHALQSLRAALDGLRGPD